MGAEKTKPKRCRPLWPERCLRLRIGVRVSPARSRLCAFTGWERSSPHGRMAGKAENSDRPSGGAVTDGLWTVGQEWRGLRVALIEFRSFRFRFSERS
jgi:hypothetical protein